MAPSRRILLASSATAAVLLPFVFAWTWQRKRRQRAKKDLAHAACAGDLESLKLACQFAIQAGVKGAVISHFRRAGAETVLAEAMKQNNATSIMDACHFAEKAGVYKGTVFWGREAARKLLHEPLPVESSGRGIDDVPGCAHVPAISALLFVGNQVSASCGKFDVVISTCVPVDQSRTNASHLTTDWVKMDDVESNEGEATRNIIHGARLIDKAIKAGKKTLVHCEWGQNRSGAICCAYAVLFCGWSAEDAIKYFRQCNFADRKFIGQRPMHNRVFNQIIASLASQRSHYLKFD